MTAKDASKESTNSESSIAASKLAFCTVSSKNYLAHVRVLSRSLKLLHPDIPFFFLLVDRVNVEFEIENEPATVVDMVSLNIPEMPQMLMRYGIVELNTAVKPFFFEFLFAKYGIAKLIYLDPDILALASLSALFEQLDTCNILLTPHLDSPINDDSSSPSELDILRVGTFNLGFLGLRKSEDVTSLLHWWKERLTRKCLKEPNHGLFVDQKWMDLVPGFFNSVKIVRDKAYNIAYWNIHSRKITRVNGAFYVDQKPVVFFHFSGVDLSEKGQLFKYQNRLGPEDLGDVRLLFRHYRNLLMQQDYEAATKWSYDLDRFSNGAKIPNAAREIYLEMTDHQLKKFPDPLNAGQKGSYFDYLNEPSDAENGYPAISRLWRKIYDTSEDLQDAFPEISGRDRRQYAEWILLAGVKQFDVDERFIHPAISQSTENFRSASFFLLRRVFSSLIFRLEPALKPVLKMLLSRDPKKIKKLKAILSRSGVSRK